MSLIVITPPKPIVTLDEAKRHLRVEDDDQDAYISALIEAATAWMDGPAGWLGRALGEQELEAAFDRWPCPFRLPCPPEIEILGITYLDQGGTRQVLSVDPDGAFQERLPAAMCRRGSIRIRYRAGYEMKDGASTVPAPVRHAILLCVGDLFANRENTGPSNANALIDMPVTAMRLIEPFRIRLFA